MSGDAGATGRARIIDAALAAFAERGDAASVRGIAAAAGCSAALVQHHFTTKEQLRQACDDYVLAFIRERVATGIGERGFTDPSFLTAAHREARTVVPYVKRRLVEDSPPARVIFGALVDLTEPHLAADDTDARSPARDRAAVLVGMKLGLLLLRGQVARVLGLSSDPTSDGRIAAAQTDLLHPGLASAELMAAARDADWSHADPSEESEETA